MKTDLNNIKTAEVSFYEHGRIAGDMFALKPGIPAEMALEQASSILSIVVYVLRQAAPSAPDSVPFAALHLVEMGKSMVDGVIEGNLKGGSNE